jgi:hypothetical protein
MTRGKSPIVLAAGEGGELRDLAGREWSAGEAPPADWRGRGLYLSGPSPWARILARYGAPGDAAAGPRVGEPAGATVAGLRVYGGAAWGLDCRPERAAEELEELRAAVDAAGLRWGSTAGSVAGAIVRAEAERAGWIGQLRPRWRAVARDALHQGPMVARVAGARECVHVDRRAAYLAALRAPMPDIARARILPRGASVDGLRRAYRAGARGIVAGVVVVECEGPADAASALAGPLPVRTRTGTRWPVGALAGAWTLDAWIAALETWPVRGAHVAGGFVSPGSPMLAPVADRIEAVADRRLRKALYTRAWGQLAFEGWPEGRIIPRPAPDAPGVWTAIGADLAIDWTAGGAGYGPGAGPIFRPELAATVGGVNLAAMTRALAVAGDGALMALVDAVFATPAAAARIMAADPDGWAVKGEGPIAIRAPGVYVHAGAVKAMGAPAWLPPAARLAVAASSTAAADPVSAERIAGGRWRDAPPAAAEVGHHSKTAAAILPRRGGPWTPRGWLRPGGEPVAETLEGED